MKALPLGLVATLSGCTYVTIVVDEGEGAPGADLTTTRTVTSASVPTNDGSAPPPIAGTPDLGAGANLRGYRFFPADNPWNERVDTGPIDPASDRLIESIGRDRTLHPDFGADWNGGPFGIPYVVVGRDQPRVPVSFTWADESDPGPYPIPPDAPVEGGASSAGDRHVLVLDRDAHRLYELFAARPDGRGGFTADSGAVFDLTKNGLRPAGWTSADAAGLPILPGLVRYDEVAAGEIRHALRFTARKTRRAYVAPATHWASQDTSPSLPPMGMRVRLKASFDVSSFPPQARVMLVALQRYGMFLADNGSDWFLSGAPDPRWSDEQLRTLKRLRGSDFEVIQLGRVVTP
jgi:hypothetical protein